MPIVTVAQLVDAFDGCVPFTIGKTLVRIIDILVNVCV